MALIVAVLGFMMSSGHWTRSQGFWSAFFNPLYFPQLAFRTTFALATAGLFVWFLIAFLSVKGSALRASAIRLAAGWTLTWLPLFIVSAWWYWHEIPQAMAANLNVALLTQQFSAWAQEYVRIAAAALAIIALTAIVGVVKPQALPRFALMIPFLMGIWLLGHFERAREFIRKPYVIADYMYSNGVRVDELPVYQRYGMLTYATYASVRSVTPENKVQAGREVFMLACSRCHTTTGVNGVVQKFTGLFGDSPWESEKLENFISGMHLTRTFMPPFPGSKAERGALAAYLQQLQRDRRSLDGAQSVGLTFLPPTTAENPRAFTALAR
jgi:mono/diheme cytochrome c family protein